MDTNKRIIAVVGATGQQGGAVIRALQAGNQFKVRALTRNPAKHRELADEVVEADLNRPETLKSAFEGAHGVFLVTNPREQGADERKQATAAVRAAKDAGVKHIIWSTLPDVEAISGGKFDVPHFTGKARIDSINFSQTSPKGAFRYILSRSRRDCRDVQLLPSSYLLGFGFVRPNCARKQNSRQATDQVFDVGSTECPGPEPLSP